MPSAEGSVSINRPIAEVFSFLAEGENNPRWRPAVVKISKASDQPVGVGTIFRQTMKTPNGELAADYEIMEYEPSSKLGFRVIAGPARPEGRYRLEPDGAGTKVHFSLQWQPSGLKWLLAPFVAMAMPKEVAALENLKQVLEKK